MSGYETKQGYNMLVDMPSPPSQILPKTQEGRMHVLFTFRDRYALTRRSTFRIDWQEKLQVTISPFQWDGCYAKLLGLPDNPDRQPLVDWFMSSFEESSSFGPDKDFSGVVHLMSDPELQGNCYLVTFDLGSAPVETFETLLDAFISVGAKSVEIGQS